MILLYRLQATAFNEYFHQPLLISVLATMVLTFFSLVVSYSYNRNFIEPSLLSKIVSYHLNDAPSWLNLTLGTVLHFVVGYLFTVIHLYLYQLYTPIWYNGIFFGLVNGLLGAVIWYLTIKIYNQVLQVEVKTYLIQLVIAHILFGLTIVWMYHPFILSV